MLLKRLFIGIAALLLMAGVPVIAAVGRSDNADLVFGGPGTGPGQFFIVRDMVFGPDGNLYVLESNGVVKMRDAEYVGQARVQVLDSTGKFLRQFALGDDIVAVKKGGPRRLAVDSNGNVAVTLPLQDCVRVFDSQGRKLRDVPLPGATVVALQRKPREAFVAVGFKEITVKREKTETFSAVRFDAAAGAEELKLSRPLRGLVDMASGPDGALYILADVNQIYCFDATGVLQKIIGSGTKTRASDGSEPIWSVAVDSKSNLYSVASSNPALITKYLADGKTVLQQSGQFKFADPWSSSDELLALDGNDRLWVGAVSIRDPKTSPRYHFEPAFLRTVPEFLKPTSRAVRTSDTRILGFNARIESVLPYGIAYDLSPVAAEFVVAPANRAVKNIAVSWTAYDSTQTAVGKGTFAMALKDGEEARTPLTFTPPRYGWYTVRATVSADGTTLATYGQHFGVTPHFAGMETLEAGESNGGWVDPARQSFAGFPNMRIHAGRDVEAQFDASGKYGLTTLVQIGSSADTMTVESARETAQKLKGRVKYIELCNEPNFFFKPEDYAARAKQLYDAIKEVDPTIQVMGPATCGIMLGWIDSFYRAGGAKTCDIISVHDYEGHESITPEHWRWKYGALRKIMAQYGDANKPIWQTERAISALRGGGSNGLAVHPVTQAIRISLRFDLCETLGIPAAHNNHYYLNEGGYSGVPSYVWTRNNGVLPGALVMRTREAETRGRTYNASLDFGPEGNQFLLGLRYGPREADGGLVTLRQLGERGTVPLAVNASGPSLHVTDTWGNETEVPLNNGAATLQIDQLPLYVRLAPNQSFNAERLDWGQNLAPSATVTYVTGRTEKSMALLNNGLIEQYHGDNPLGGTGNAGPFNGPWRGEPVTPESPQTLELAWAAPRRIDRVLVRGVRADNTFAAPQDLDIQAWQDGTWKTVSEIRTATPESYAARMGDATAVEWGRDDNLKLAHFPALTTAKLRVVLRRMTYGLHADKTGAAFFGWTAPSPAMLREIEVFGPLPAVDILAASASLPKNEIQDDERRPTGFASDAVTVVLHNNGAAPVSGTLRAIAPAGWSVAPVQQAVSITGAGKTETKFTVTPPARLENGSAAVDFALDEAKSVGAMNYQFLSPLRLETAPVVDAKDGPQSFGITLKNNGDTPLEGSVTLTLDGPRTVTAEPQKFGPLVKGEPALLTFAVPGLKLNEGAWHARFEALAGGIASLADQNLAVREWNVAGPFENDFDKDFGPEKLVDLKQVFTDAVGNEARWQVATSDATGFVDFTKLFDQKTEATAYAVAWVKSPVARRALLSHGSDDGSKLWWNDALVITANTRRGAKPDSDVVPVDLKAGWNKVLIKVVQSSGGWGFYCDLLDPQTKQPLVDVSFSPRPQ